MDKIFISELVERLDTSLFYDNDATITLFELANIFQEIVDDNVASEYDEDDYML